MNSDTKITSSSTVTLGRNEYEKLLSENSFLKEQLADLKRMIFGAKSERFIPTDHDQLRLFDAATKDPEQSTEEISYRRTKQKKDKQHPIRTALPAHLPRVEETIEPEQLAKDAKKIGEEITEILEYNPGNIFVRKIIRPKYVNPNQEGIVIGELPSLPIPKGNAGSGLLAHIQVSKFVDHLPFYRQIQIFKRGGVELSDSTMNGWFNATCDLLQPLYEKQVKELLTQGYLQADESPIRVLDSNKSKSTHTGYHWVYHAPIQKLVVFDYQPTRSREGPRNFLKDFTGTLQSDGYKAYDELTLGKEGQFTMLGCMAHARRYFEKALDNDKVRAIYALELIKELYAIEREARENGLSHDDRKGLRVKDAKPLLEEFKAWLDNHLNQVVPKSKTGKAIAYTLNLWPRLIGYLDDGKYLIDNNTIENTIRPLAIGRKNYLFAGSHKAAQKAAMMYSFFATCKMNEVEPFAWLKDVLERIPEHKANKLHELLPQSWRTIR